MTSPEDKRTEHAETSAHDDYLLYDGECPFCSFYARKSEFRTPNGRPLKLIDANRAPKLLGELRVQGCEVDEGMVLVMKGKRYQGAQAMSVLESMMSESGWWGSFSRLFASNPSRVRVFYPWFRRLRRVALWVGRKGISRR